MARPRKDSKTPGAHQRLVDAYLALASETRGRLTVTALVEHAGCNRDTFYYHFESMDDLAAQVVVQLFAPEIPAAILGCLRSGNPLTLDEASRKRARDAYALLAMRPELKPLAVARIKALWTEQLQEEGGGCEPIAPLLLDILASGAVEVLAGATETEDEPPIGECIMRLAAFIRTDALSSR